MLPNSHPMPLPAWYLKTIGTMPYSAMVRLRTLRMTPERRQRLMSPGRQRKVWSGVGGTPSTGDGILVNSWISENGADAAPSTITVTEIPYDLYDLYIYVGHDRDDEDTGFSETGGAFTNFITLEDVNDTSVAADPFVFNEITTSGGMGNYFVSSGLSQDSLNIEFAVENGERAPVSGFQIVQVPEPSSLVLLSVAVLLVGRFVRRKKSH